MLKHMLNLHISVFYMTASTADAAIEKTQW